MVVNVISNDDELDQVEISEPNPAVETNLIDGDENNLVSGDDVFLPDASKITGIDDYQQVKEALSWTSVSYFWPEADQVDWVVLEGKAFLSSDTPTISVIQGDTAEVTVTSGQNLIFFSGSSLKLNQTGGAAEVFFDPDKDAKVDLNHLEGVTSFSYLTTEAPHKTESKNEDGSRTLNTGGLSLTYNTGETSKIFIQDLITGDANRAEATNTILPASEKVKTVDQGVGGVLEEPVDFVDNSEMQQSSDAPPSVYPRIVKDVIEIEDGQSRQAEQAEEDELLFDDDVLIDREPTDIAQQYFGYAPTAAWKYSVDEYVTPNDYSFTVDGQKRDVDIARSERVYAEVQDDIANQFTELFAANDWTDFLATDILDVFYAD